MEEVYSVWAGRVASKKIFQGEFIYMNKMMVEEKEEEIHRILIKKNRMKPSLLQLNLSFLA
jgi:fido (protein-threonine AMPylation protein)